MPSGPIFATIIGAGPYGLSIAAHLRSRAIPLRIFGKPMLAWREHMPKGMLLKSEGFASNLYDNEDRFTLQRYCQSNGLPYADVGDPVPLQTFVSYGLDFQRQVVPSLEQDDVTRLQRNADHFILTTARGESFASEHVIVASGIKHFAYIPPALAGLPAGYVTHSCDHSDLSGFAGRSVAVIGAGASAVDVAALLHEQGANVALIARRAAIAFHDRSAEPRPLLQRLWAPRSGLGIGWRSRLCTDAPMLFYSLPQDLRHRIVERHLGPAPGWPMKARVVGRFPLHEGAQIEQIEPRGTKVHIKINQTCGARPSVEVDHVIAATGYKVDVRRIDFIDPELGEKIRSAEGVPALSRQFESSVKGLYFVGLAAAYSFGPLTRFAFGARFTARTLARHLQRSHARRPGGHG